MTRIRKPGLFVFLWSVLTLAAGARAVVVHQAAAAIFVTLFWAAAQGAGLWYARTHEDAPPKKAGEAIAVFGMLAFVLEIFLGGIVQALMSLLLWLQAAKNPALATRRDVYFALLISLTLIIFSASEARSALFLPLLTAYGLSVFGTLVYCHQQSGFEEELQAAPAGDGASLRSLSLLHLAVLTSCVFLVAFLWYLLAPRPAAVNFGAVSTRGGEKYSRSDWENEAQSGQKKGSTPDSGWNAPPPEKRQDYDPLSEEFDTMRSEHDGGIKDGRGLGNGIVMYVQADRLLYLRERSYDRFRNNRWSASDGRTRKLLQEEGRFNLSNQDAAADEKVQYMVQVVVAIDGALPLSAHAVSVKAPAGVIAQAADGAVFLADRIAPGFRYSATSLIPKDAQRPIARDMRFDRARYLQLPEGYSPRIGELARQVSANAVSPYDKALALEAHLRSNYAYSVETIVTSQKVTPLEEFLFETRRGHCEFFASAMAIMLRETGIPSRVVHGFLAHSYNPVTGLYEVRALDGHAWVEAYFEGTGWITFEPTAAYPLPQRQQQSGSTLTDLKTYTEKLAQQETLQGRRSSMQSLSAFLREMSDAWHLLLFRLQSWLDVLSGWVQTHVLLLALVAAGLALAAFAAYRMRVQLLWLWIRIAMRRTPDTQMPLLAFRQLERLARSRQLGRAIDETVDDYLARLQKVYAESHKELHQLRRAFNAARYDARKLNAEEAAVVLRAFHKVGALLTAS